MNMREPFTERARRVVVLAQEEAQRLGHAYIGTEHLLLGILSESESLAAKACADHGITFYAARNVVEHITAHVEKQAVVSYEMTFTPRAKRAVEIAYEESRKRGLNYVGTESIFIAIFLEGKGAGYKALVELGLSDVLAKLSGPSLPTAEPLPADSMHVAGIVDFVRPIADESEAK